jgi:hypothetical protein
MRLLTPLLSTLLAVMPLTGLSQDMSQRFRLEAETGAAWQARNDVQIPNDAAGTRFSLQDTVGSGPVPLLRLDAAWALSERQDVRVLLAPFGYEEGGALVGPVNFNGASFAAGPVEATYRFNSWRATWRYRLAVDGPWLLKLGVTAKIRDAEIGLSQGITTATDTDVGFVPLLHVYSEYRFNERWKGIVDADLMAAPQGRAFDVGIKAAYDFNDTLSLTAGYRILDGGADNDTVYNFARFDQAVASLIWRF